MKTKILNWIYWICGRILATDNTKRYWSETRIPERLRYETAFNDRHLPIRMQSKEAMEDQVKNKLLKELYSKLVVVSKKAPWDDQIFIYSVEILIVDVNGTNKIK